MNRESADHELLLRTLRWKLDASSRQRPGSELRVELTAVEAECVVRVLDELESLRAVAAEHRTHLAARRRATRLLRENPSDPGVALESLEISSGLQGRKYAPDDQIRDDYIRLTSRPDRQLSPSERSSVDEFGLPGAELPPFAGDLGPSVPYPPEFALGIIRKWYGFPTKRAVLERLRRIRKADGVESGDPGWFDLPTSRTID